MPHTIAKRGYEAELLRLQAELTTMTEWIRETGARVVVVFEGRDAAGKGGVIKRISEYLSPRICRTVALPAPDRARADAVVLPALRGRAAVGRRDRPVRPQSGTTGPGSSTSWASAPRASTTGSCAQCPVFEHLLIEDGIILVKYWFSVSDEEQERRFQSRVDDPLRRWKLSAMDLEARQRWSDYSRAKDAMFLHTDTPESPWYVVDAEDKRARPHQLHRPPARPRPLQPGRRGPPQAARSG